MNDDEVLSLIRDEAREQIGRRRGPYHDDWLAECERRKLDPYKAPCPQANVQLTAIEREPTKPTNAAISDYVPRRRRKHEGQAAWEM